jgi:hypothetical protein
MLSKINLAFVGALTLLPHLAFAADATLPTANVESMCQAEQSAAPPDSKASDFQSCVKDERKALNELRRKWARYPIKARATCAFRHHERRCLARNGQFGRVDAPGPSAVGRWIHKPPLAPTAWRRPITRR